MWHVVGCRGMSHMAWRGVACPYLCRGARRRSVPGEATGTWCRTCRVLCPGLAGLRPRHRGRAGGDGTRPRGGVAGTHVCVAWAASGGAALQHACACPWGGVGTPGRGWEGATRVCVGRVWAESVYIRAHVCVRVHVGRACAPGLRCVHTRVRPCVLVCVRKHRMRVHVPPGHVSGDDATGHAWGDKATRTRQGTMPPGHAWSDKATRTPMG